MRHFSLKNERESAANGLLDGDTNPKMSHFASEKIFLVREKCSRLLAGQVHTLSHSLCLPIDPALLV